MCATCSSATIPPRSWWTGQLMAKVPTASPCTSEARQAISCAAARTGSGGTLSTIIKGRRCDSPPDICAPRQLWAMEPLLGDAVLVKEVFHAATGKMKTGTVSHAEMLKGWFVMVKDSKGRYAGNKLWGDGRCCL